MEVASFDHQSESPQTARNDEDIADEVKVRCWDQREALPGEPRCVICGRYGEYICDETDDDICSLECKNSLLQKLAKSRLPSSLASHTRLPTTDECFYVKDHENESSFQKAELLRKRLDICVKGAPVPPPVLSFSSCDLPSKLIENMESLGFELPTPVQMQAIPAGLAGKSLLVSAETGSGKTASYLIPIISRSVQVSLEHSRVKKNPIAIVMTPTRELCVQVEEEAKVLGKGLPFKTALVVGGDAMAGQVYRIQSGVELIVGTPGRLVDLLTKHDIELDEVSVFVLDEVDAMLQRGFRDQVMQVFQALSRPQILMFSATVGSEVKRTASSMCKNITFISIGIPNTPNQTVKQLAIWVETKQKKQKLFEILTSSHHFKPPVVVFVGSRLGADLLAEAVIVATGIKARSIHGEKSMKDRRDIMGSFLRGEVSVLIATGLLGRGVDLIQVRQVILFDMPNSIKEYVHLIGRASRLGDEGNAIVFVNEENKRMFPQLIDVLKSSGAVVPKDLANSRYAVSSFPFSSKSNRKRKHGG